MYVAQIACLAHICLIQYSQALKWSPQWWGGIRQCIYLIIKRQGPWQKYNVANLFLVFYHSLLRKMCLKVNLACSFMFCIFYICKNHFIKECDQLTLKIIDFGKEDQHVHVLHLAKSVYHASIICGISNVKLSHFCNSINVNSICLFNSTEYTEVFQIRLALK